MVENSILSWNIVNNESAQVVMTVLGQVNDTLKENDVDIYFGIVPSQKVGLEVCGFKR